MPKSIRNCGQVNGNITMKQIYLISLLVLAGACSTPATKSLPAPSSSYAEAHAAAVAAMELAQAHGHAWSSSEVLLAEGAAAAEAGDNDLAIQLADKARVQAELSIQQAKLEESAWTERVLSD
jgi:hypothetical protein